MRMSAISNWWFKLRKQAGKPKLLCDTCLYDYHTACSNPKRPNATDCPDYKKK